MNTRKVSTEYRLSKWAQLIQAKVENGQSIEEFCECEGISRNTYFYWQRKLREAAMELVESTPTAGNGLVPSGWARLEPTAPSEGGIIIEVGGCKVTATSETDTDLLANVCRMLKTL